MGPPISMNFSAVFSVAKACRIRDLVFLLRNGRRATGERDSAGSENAIGDVVREWPRSIAEPTTVSRSGRG